MQNIVWESKDKGSFLDSYPLRKITISDNVNYSVSDNVNYSIMDILNRIERKIDRLVECCEGRNKTVDEEVLEKLYKRVY